MRRLYPSSARPARMRDALDAGDDYGVSDEPDWRSVDWHAHLHQAEIDGRRVNYVDIGSGDDDTRRLRPRPLGPVAELAREHSASRREPPRRGTRPARDGHSEMPPERISIQGYARDGHRAARAPHSSGSPGRQLDGRVRASEVTIRRPQLVERLVLVSAAGITTANLYRSPAALLARVLGVGMARGRRPVPRPRPPAAQPPSGARARRAPPVQAPSGLRLRGAHLRRRQNRVPAGAPRLPRLRLPRPRPRHHLPDAHRLGRGRHGPPGQGRARVRAAPAGLAQDRPEGHGPHPDGRAARHLQRRAPRSSSAAPRRSRRPSPGPPDRQLGFTAPRPGQTLAVDRNDLRPGVALARRRAGDRLLRGSRRTSAWTSP